MSRECLISELLVTTVPKNSPYHFRIDILAQQGHGLLNPTTLPSLLWYIFVHELDFT